eukprot:scaffold74461_cov18-Prasinocladus_malaysianus.AAC.1
MDKHSPQPTPNGQSPSEKLMPCLSRSGFGNLLPVLGHVGIPHATLSLRGPETKGPSPVVRLSLSNGMSAYRLDS